MAYFIGSIDRSFCPNRCTELGICYNTTVNPVCLCDDGRIGGDCGVGVSSTHYPVVPNPMPWTLLVVGIVIAVLVVVVLTVSFLLVKLCCRKPSWKASATAVLESGGKQPSAPELELDAMGSEQFAGQQSSIRCSRERQPAEIGPFDAV
ncbi:hypothetical protein Q1695_004353 [Nippostrongylus brasiliensis]|nr:hypothetical protein Q1695_004353 [Nippostrongylus brasiliensis]